MSNPHLIAYAVNATSLESAEIAFAVAEQDEDGDWFTPFGQRLIPWWSCPLWDVFCDNVSVLAAPPALTQSHIDHLHAEAAKNMNPAPERPKLSDLFKAKPVTMTRRI